LKKLFKRHHAKFQANISLYNFLKELKIAAHELSVSLEELESDPIEGRLGVAAVLNFLKGTIAHLQAKRLFKCEKCGEDAGVLTGLREILPDGFFSACKCEKCGHSWYEYLEYY